MGNLAVNICVIVSTISMENDFGNDSVNISNAESTPYRIYVQLPPAKASPFLISKFSSSALYEVLPGDCM